MKSDIETNGKNNHLETTKHSDSIRLDMGKFIETMNTLISKLADKHKKLEAVVAMI